MPRGCTSQWRLVMNDRITCLLIPVCWWLPRVGRLLSNSGTLVRDIQASNHLVFAFSRHASVPIIFWGILRTYDGRSRLPDLVSCTLTSPKPPQSIRRNEWFIFSVLYCMPGPTMACRIQYMCCWKTGRRGGARGERLGCIGRRANARGCPGSYIRVYILGKWINVKDEWKVN